jgi:hypothetical protein
MLQCVGKSTQTTSVSASFECEGVQECEVVKT